jgi:hypothetical protein
VTSGDRERLLCWITMIKIHHVRTEHFSAVGARHPPEVAKECTGRVLAPLNAIKLSLPVRRVVADVVRTLITRVAHGPL